MRTLLFVAASLLLAWQAAMGAIALGDATRARSGTSWHDRFAATTDERIRKALGDDAQMLFELRARSRGTLLLCQTVDGLLAGIRSPADIGKLTTADFERLNARNGLMVQLTHLLFPDPPFLPVREPIDAVEEQVRHGKQAALCVLPGDPTPETRVGWTRTHETPRLQIWTFRTE